MKYAGEWHTPDGKTSSKGILELTEENFTLSLIGLEESEGEVEKGVPIQGGKLKGLRVRILDISSSDFECLVCDSAKSPSEKRTAISIFGVNFRRSRGGSWFDHLDSYLEYSPQYALLGRRTITDIEAPVFTEVTYGVTMLGGLLPNTRLREGMKRDEYDFTLHVLSDKEVKPLTFELGNLNIIFHFTYQPTLSKQGVQINELGKFTVKFSKGQPLSECLEWGDWLMQLLRFFYGCDLSSTSVSATAFEGQDENASSVKYSILRRGSLHIEPKQPKDAAKILVQDIGDFQKVLKQWAEANKSLRRSLGTWLFANKARSDYFLDTQLVELMAVIDSLAQSDEGNKKLLIPKEEFRKIREKLIESLPEDLPDEIKTRLRDNIQLMNKRSQQEFLKMYLDRYDEVCKKMTDIDNDKLARIIVKNRNAIAHGNAEVKEFIYKDIETLYKMVELLSRLTWVALAERLGIERSIALSASRKYHRGNSLRLELADFYPEKK